MSGRRRRHAAPDELERPRPVRWLSPSVLARTAIQVVLSSVFERFADKREQQAGVDAPVIVELAAGDEAWVDYVSDLGDGFDGTVTVAHLLARPRLEVGLPDTGGEQRRTTQRGELLVMGGDQVYPFADIAEYERRFVEPYKAVLPHTDPPHPLLVALPGNHDWYDGLTSFLRVFAQGRRGDDPHGRWIGGWRTTQRRSYFAVQLPQRWWLWGIDIQLDTYIDGPQLDWFAAASRLLAPGDGVILCSAKPGWLSAGPDEPEAYSVLDFFEREMIRPTGAHLRLSLTGDHHSYARYVHRPTGEHKVMAGGGGAYLAATHHLPSAVHVPPEESTDRGKTETRTFELATTSDGHGGVVEALFPSRRESRAQAARFWRAGFGNGRGFVALLAGVHGVMGAAAAARSWRSWTALAPVTASAAALVALTKERRRRPVTALVAGLGHTAAHVGVAAATVAIARRRDPSIGWWRVGALSAAAGGALGPLVFGAYLWVADNRARLNTNELFAGQAICGYKCFVRLHVRPDGAVELYPIGVDGACRRWAVHPPGDGTTARVTPVEPIEHRLIDGPIVLGREPAPDFPSDQRTEVR